MSNLFKYKFLCTNCNKENYVIGIKKAKSEWHYFDIEDTDLGKHPKFLSLKLIKKMERNKESTVSVCLKEDEKMKYYCDETNKFVFNDKPLKTRK